MMTVISEKDKNVGSDIFWKKDNSPEQELTENAPPPIPLDNPQECLKFYNKSGNYLSIKLSNFSFGSPGSVTVTIGEDQP